MAGAQRVLLGVGRQKMDVLAAQSQGHVRGRVAALLAADGPRLALRAAVDAAVQPVAPWQLDLARTLGWRARFQAQRHLVFLPVLWPRTNVGVQRDGVRRGLQAAVRELFARVAGNAPAPRACLRGVACRAVQLSADGQIEVYRMRVTEPVTIAVVFIGEREVHVRVAAGDVPRTRVASSVATHTARAVRATISSIAPRKTSGWAALPLRWRLVGHPNFGIFSDDEWSTGWYDVHAHGEKIVKWVVS
jgi:hypothetical protein